MDLAFPGFDKFEATPVILHAIFLLRDAIPKGCEGIKVEFDEQGAALVTASRPGDEYVDVTLSEDAMSAAGMLLTLGSYQVIALTKMYEPQGEEAVTDAQERLTESLAEIGLDFGILNEPFVDSVMVYIN